MDGVHTDADHARRYLAALDIVQQHGGIGDQGGIKGNLKQIAEVILGPEGVASAESDAVARKTD